MLPFTMSTSFFLTPGPKATCCVASPSCRGRLPVHTLIVQRREGRHYSPRETLLGGRSGPWRARPRPLARRESLPLPQNGRWPQIAPCRSRGRPRPGPRVIQCSRSIQNARADHPSRTPNSPAEHNAAILHGYIQPSLETHKIVRGLTAGAQPFHEGFRPLARPAHQLFPRSWRVPDPTVHFIALNIKAIFGAIISWKSAQLPDGIEFWPPGAPDSHAADSHRVQNPIAGIIAGIRKKFQRDFSEG